MNGHIKNNTIITKISQIHQYLTKEKNIIKYLNIITKNIESLLLNLILHRCKTGITYLLIIYSIFRQYKINILRYAILNLMKPYLMSLYFNIYNLSLN